jgi:nitrous oxidase accessory protein
VEADDVEISSCALDDVLFGVALQGANRGLVCGNRITSKADEPSMRGDAVRIWYGTGNRVFGNDIDGARDVSLANAPANVVEHNRIRRGRIGAQVVFSPRTRLEANLLDSNISGVAILYSNEVEVRRNRLLHSRGMAGSGLTFKESSHCVAEGNEVVDCSVAVKANAPTSPDNVITFERNRFAHNLAGMDFYGENGGHLIHQNAFEHNLRQVTVSGPMSARGNDWRGNYFDDYEGFDQNRDGVGDQPYELYAFADRIWMEVPQATFFRNSPAFELLDFLERLAPFASPELTLKDPSPAMAPPVTELPSFEGFTPSCP